MKTLARQGLRVGTLLRSPATLGGREFWKGSGSPNDALNYRVWGIPAALSRGIPGNALRAFPGSFRIIFPEFLPESPSRTGGMAQKRKFSSRTRIEADQPEGP